MAIPGTIGVNSPIAPQSASPTGDAYPSHLSLYGKGGLRTVDTVADRNGIISQRREEGMQVYVKAERKTYRLSFDSSWVEILDASVLPALTLVENYAVTFVPTSGYFMAEVPINVPITATVSLFLNDTLIQTQLKRVDKGGGVFRFQFFANNVPIGTYRAVVFRK